MPIRGMYDTWISGCDVNYFCCYGLALSIPSGFLAVFEKPNRSSFTFTFTHAHCRKAGGGKPQVEMGYDIFKGVPASTTLRSCGQRRTVPRLGGP
jgi:hypothetical protein